MENSYIAQLAGVVLVLFGLIGAALTGEIFDAILDAQSGRRPQGEWGTRGTAFSGSTNWNTFLFLSMVLCGIFLLIYTHFEPCSFLEHWIPSLSQDFLTMLKCE